MRESSKMRDSSSIGLKTGYFFRAKLEEREREIKKKKKKKKNIEILVNNMILLFLKIKES